MPKWRNRQTRYVQGVVGVTPWEFKSPLRHRRSPTAQPAWANRTEACTFTTEDEDRTDGRWRRARGKSGLHRARVPGESRGGASAPTVHTGARETAREQQRPFPASAGVKRAILPAAISESAVTRLLAEAGSREQSRRRRRDRSIRTERDDRHEQNPAYGPAPSSPMVPLAQSAERLSVEQEVTGSCPVRHPR